MSGTSKHLKGGMVMQITKKKKGGSAPRVEISQKTFPGITIATGGKITPKGMIVPVVHDQVRGKAETKEVAA